MNFGDEEMMEFVFAWCVMCVKMRVKVKVVGRSERGFFWWDKGG